MMNYFDIKEGQSARVAYPVSSIKAAEVLEESSTTHFYAFGVLNLTLAWLVRKFMVQWADYLLNLSIDLRNSSIISRCCSGKCGSDLKKTTTTSLKNTSDAKSRASSLTEASSSLEDESSQLSAAEDFAASKFKDANSPQMSTPTHHLHRADMTVPTSSPIISAPKELQHKCNFKYTQNFLIKLKALQLKENQYLRLFVQPGGCFGYTWKFIVDEKIAKNDIKLFEKLVVDQFSIETLQNATLDFEESIHASQFTVKLFTSQMEKSSQCSCESSFDVE